MTTRLKILFAVLFFIFVALAFSYKTYAMYVFGGQASQVIGCYNDYIFAKVGPPRPQEVLWAPSYTRTYAYGPPQHAGQWLLGLYNIYSYCLVSKQPIVIFDGYVIFMMGSSR